MIYLSYLIYLYFCIMYELRYTVLYLMSSSKFVYLTEIRNVKFRCFIGKEYPEPETRPRQAAINALVTESSQIQSRTKRY